LPGGDGQKSHQDHSWIRSSGETIQRLEQFLVYADDSRREIETVNLLVQRNIPVTFMKSAAEVINDTIDPDETPRIMKAIPVAPPPAKASAKSSAPARGKKSKRAATVFIAETNSERKEGIRNGQ
jgi:hypothetical protein